MHTITLRKAIVIPTALTLALGGALLVSAPANAATPFAIDTYSAQSPTYLVKYTGTATIGDDVALEDSTGAIIDSTTAVDNGAGTGAWTLSHKFDNTDAVQQNLTIVDDPNGTSPESALAPVTLPSLTIATPTSVVAGSSVAVSGTAPIGAQNVTVTDANSHTTTNATVAANGDWTATVAEPAGATTDTLAATGVTSAAEPLNTATTPAFAVAPAPSTLTVAQPTNGYVATRRTVTFSGTGTAGQEIDLVASGIPAPDNEVTTKVASDGTWSVDLFFLPADPNAETVTVAQDSDGGSIVVNLTLPTPPVVLAPVIVKPGAGSSSTSETVTYSGTSEPGTYVQVLALPTAEYQKLVKEAASAQPDASSSLAPLDSVVTDPVLVAADGTWTVTQKLAVGDWTAIAVDEANSDGSPITAESVTNPDNSIASDPREFVITAPVTVTAAATTTGPTLAYTGSNEGPEMALAGLLLLGGAALVAANAVRRRRVRG